MLKLFAKANTTLQNKFVRLYFHLFGVKLWRVHVRVNFEIYVRICIIYSNTNVGALLLVAGKLISILAVSRSYCARFSWEMCSFGSTHTKAASQKPRRKTKIGAVLQFRLAFPLCAQLLIMHSASIGPRAHVNFDN